MSRQCSGQIATSPSSRGPATGPAPGPREFGDVAICPEYCVDMSLHETAIHGVLHLCGYDHEADDGEMLALQAKVLAGLR